MNRESDLGQKAKQLLCFLLLFKKTKQKTECVAVTEMWLVQGNIANEVVYSPFSIHLPNLGSSSIP